MTVFNIVKKNIVSRQSFTKSFSTVIQNRLSKNEFDLVLNHKQLCNLECIASGAFNPIKTFMNKSDYNSVIYTHRLSCGTFFPMPITLGITSHTLSKIEESQKDVLCLRDHEYNEIAILKIEDVFDRNEDEGTIIYGNENIIHEGNKLITGKLDVLQKPVHYDYIQHRHTTKELQALFPKHKPIIAFHTTSPIYKQHIDIINSYRSSLNGVALIHPVVAVTNPGEIDYHTRMKCYNAVINNGMLNTNLTDSSIILSILPLCTYPRSERDVLWHAFIRQNYGATHFVFLSTDKNTTLQLQEQHALQRYQDELRIKIISDYNENQALDANTDVKVCLSNNKCLPDWVSPACVANILTKRYPPNNNTGFTLFFTGLSGSGKSTIARALMTRLQEITDRQITLLDGDEVRTFLSSELGFNREHRDLNIMRIGFVASEISKARGISICAAIAPFRNARMNARELVERNGHFIEIFVDTRLETCEHRDRKGLYKKARLGILPEFTGIDSPYEEPDNPEITIRTESKTVNESVDTIIDYLLENGYFAHQ